MKQAYMIKAKAIGVVGLKDGIFIPEVLDPGVEPWFIVDCLFFGDAMSSVTYSRFTKDAKAYYDVGIIGSMDYFFKHTVWPSHILNSGIKHFAPSEQSMVQEAIKRYVNQSLCSGPLAVDPLIPPMLARL